MNLKDYKRDIVELSIKSGYNHVAPALSVADIVYTLYNNILKSEDRFILSKGHACLALYSILRFKGLNPSMKFGHPDIEQSQGIYCTTGSLGHGLPIGVGVAFAKKFKKEEGNVYVLIGDGECQEGTTWESLLLGSQFKLDNLVVIIDNNGLQAIDFLENVISLNNLKTKLESFNWNVYEIDGHDCLHIGLTLLKIPKNNKPTIIIANTIKGKGIKNAENNPCWHARLPKKEDIDEKYLC
jgi:transketolase